MARVMRHEVLIDGETHDIFCGKVLHVASRKTNFVEFWALDVDLTWKTFTIAGTGHPVDISWSYVGTALSPRGGLVWHLFEVA